RPGAGKRLERWLELYRGEPGKAFELRGEILDKELVSSTPRYRWRGDDEIAISGANGQLYLLSDSSPYLTRLRSPNQGDPRKVSVEGTTIFARDDQQALEVDASDPRHPVRVAGGPHRAAPVAWIEIRALGAIGVPPPREPTAKYFDLNEFNSWFGQPLL